MMSEHDVSNVRLTYIYNRVLWGVMPYSLTLSPVGSSKMSVYATSQMTALFVQLHFEAGMKNGFKRMWRLPAFYNCGRFSQGGV